jgi:4-diphosphocytidyl-2-C-methyl-D-erythritol kinase
MIVFPNAKINIGLRIIDKRSDGYHNIETIFYPIKLCDALEFIDSDEHLKSDSLTVTGINNIGETRDNLVIKMLSKIRSRYRFPFLKIHLHKAIPAGAGLGGGSSDAACMGRVVNRHFGLNIDISELRLFALEVGSDCPFFVDGVPSIASGRGEILAPAKSVLSGYYLVIANPGVEISTREAYGNCNSGVHGTPLSELIERPVSEWKGLITNDFEEFAFGKYPIIGRIKQKFYESNAIFSLMSGSGSSVYGIFKEKTQLPENMRMYTVWEGMM